LGRGEGFARDAGGAAHNDGVHVVERRAQLIAGQTVALDEREVLVVGERRQPGGRHRVGDEDAERAGRGACLSCVFGGDGAAPIRAHAKTSVSASSSASSSSIV